MPKDASTHWCSSPQESFIKRQRLVHYEGKTELIQPTCQAWPKTLTCQSKRAWEASLGVTNDPHARPLLFHFPWPYYWKGKIQLFVCQSKMQILLDLFRLNRSTAIPPHTCHAPHVQWFETGSPTGFHKENQWGVSRAFGHNYNEWMQLHTVSHVFLISVSKWMICPVRIISVLHKVWRESRANSFTSLYQMRSKLSLNH